MCSMITCSQEYPSYAGLFQVKSFASWNLYMVVLDIFSTIHTYHTFVPYIRENVVKQEFLGTCAVCINLLLLDFCWNNFYLLVTCW